MGGVVSAVYASLAGIGARVVAVGVSALKAYRFRDSYDMLIAWY